MSDNFTSVYDAMPPLNRLCEITTAADKIFKARFVFDTKSQSARWWRTRESDGVNIIAPQALSWRVVETKEECEKWFKSSTQKVVE